MSKIASTALLDGDEAALVGYRRGARASYQSVARLYERANLAHLLELAEFRG